MEKKLSKKILIKGKIKTVTGLHIGGSNTSIQIGGLDNPIIRNPLDNKPYIPGSSLKGKIRCLLEQSIGVAGTISMGGKIQYGPTDLNSGPKAKPILNLFGVASGDNNNIPSKFIVRDCNIIDENDELLKNRATDLPYTEAKPEIVLDRITAAANPRQLERVPAGVEFSLDLVVNIFDGDKEEEMMNLVFNGMRLLQDDYLGGSGSRGSGQIAFEIEEVIEREAAFYAENNMSLERTYTKVAIPLELQAKKS